MKTLEHIPTKKFERAGRLVRTGAKLGGNYLKYYGEKVFSGEEKARDSLNRDNAEDIYDSLKELKGSALKVAQMLSMEEGIMPKEFVEKFSLSQFSVPPLSGALVRKTFRRYFGKNPEQIFDYFTPDAVNAATIGQVHQAQKGDKKLAVKIQYPGVKDSISSDLKIVKPVAMRMFNIRKEGSEKYFQEVEDKLLEETDYQLELRRSQEFARDCRHISNLCFPQYYPEYSSEKILTMDWMEGLHFSEYTKEEHPQEVLNKVGQTLWDFYMYQLHVLKKLHADPHPGNFLVSKQDELLVIDFGCIKEIPKKFYKPYLELVLETDFQDTEALQQKLFELEFLTKEDTPEENEFFTQLFRDMLTLLTQPFHVAEFDFSNEDFFQNIANLGQRYAKLNEMRSMNTNRGSKHFIYINRTLLGLYNMMHSIQAKHVKINHYKTFIKKKEAVV